MAKRLSEKEKEEIIKRFTLGESIAELSEFFNCTNSTIKRNLIKSLGEIKYKKIILKEKSSNQFPKNNTQKLTVLENKRFKKSIRCTEI